MTDVRRDEARSTGTPLAEAAPSESPLHNETVVVPAHHGPPVDLELEIAPTIAHGLYSNLVLISHSRDEFTLELAYMQPSNKALLQARVILPIAQVRELSDALFEQLYRHAQRFGTPSGSTPSGSTR
jgi:hypothetical protein